MARRKTVKPSTETLSLSGNQNFDKPLTATEQAKLKEMIQLANLEYIRAVQKSIVKEKTREIESLDQQIKEFLGHYLLIGYDLNNQPVEMISTSNPVEQDSLLERFRRFVFKINQNIVNTNGEDPYGNYNKNNG